jgi:hypothetical protein
MFQNNDRENLMEREPVRRAQGMALLGALTLIAPSVYAGTGAGRAAIEHIGSFNNSELVFFYIASHADGPACNNYRQRWVLDISTTLGKSQYAFLLAAITSGAEIRVSGTGGCSLYSDSETVSWLGQPVSYTGDSSQIPGF